MINSILAEDTRKTNTGSDTIPLTNEYDDDLKLANLDTFKQNEPNESMSHVHTEIPGFSGFPTSNLTKDQLQNMKCFPRPTPTEHGIT